MDRLYCPARFMLVSDLDYTMVLLSQHMALFFFGLITCCILRGDGVIQVDHDDRDNNALLRFNAMWEAYFHHDSLLIFSSGRSPTAYKELRNEKPLLTPDITVMSVGTEIAYGDSIVPDIHWEQSLNKKWNKNIVTEVTAKLPELVLQSETEQRPHKVSFFVEKTNAFKVIEVLQRRLIEKGLDIKIFYSRGVALDVLPRGARKGQALTYLMNKFNGKIPKNTRVSNAQEELNNQNILHAFERCAAGIMQAIGHFDLGPYLSPRDELDSRISSKIFRNPAFEVVDTYLAYEKWLRGEVEESEKFIQIMKAKLHLSGVFVHASGVEKALNECLDALDLGCGWIKFHLLRL
ncbi:Sucrose-phosphatase 2, partial [Bienertia sinuspersici]